MNLEGTKMYTVNKKNTQHTKKKEILAGKQCKVCTVAS